MIDETEQMNTSGLAAPIVDPPGGVVAASLIDTPPPVPPFGCSENIDDLAFALAEAQGRINSPAKNREVRVTMKSGGSYSFKYATLDAVIEAVRAPLSAAGLAFIQTLGADGSGKYRLATTLVHASGQWISSETPLLVEEKTSQGFGSALTYMRRYALCAMLGVAADEDDDGGAASAGQAVAKGRASAKAGATKAGAKTVKRGAAVAPSMIPVPVDAGGEKPDWSAWRERIDKAIAYAPDNGWLTRFTELNDAAHGNYAHADRAGNAALDKLIDNRRGMLAQAPLDDPKERDGIEI